MVTRTYEIKEQTIEKDELENKRVIFLVKASEQIGERDDEFHNPIPIMREDLFQVSALKTDIDAQITEEDRLTFLEATIKTEYIEYLASQYKYPEFVEAIFEEEIVK